MYRRRCRFRQQTRLEPTDSMSNVSNMERKPRGLREAVSELKRELNVRNRCYDRWVEDGKIDQVDAIDRLDRLWTAIGILEAVQADADSAEAGLPGTSKLPTAKEAP